MRLQIENMLGVKAYDIYGLSEIMGPSVSQTCRYQNGLHIWEDKYIAEIIDPDTEAVLPAGSQGELVFTTLTKEGFPLIRYRTRDISVLNESPCACGRSHGRMSRLLGRTDDMLIIRGINVFPSQIESVLLTTGEATPHYQIVVERINNLDRMTVEIEVSEAMFSDHVKGLESFEHKIRNQIESTLGITCKVRLVEPKSIPRSEGKAKRVIDKRKI
jgi:phenylacetate-CoA ligase